MSQDLDRELARLWRVSRTAHEMCRDRVSLRTSTTAASAVEITHLTHDLNQGYLVADYEINVPFEEFKAAHGSSGAVECAILQLLTDIH